jgi:hypothetical protein
VVEVDVTPGLHNNCENAAGPLAVDRELSDCHLGAIEGNDKGSIQEHEGKVTDGCGDHALLVVDGGLIDHKPLVEHLQLRVFEGIKFSRIGDGRWA